jgi:hypothetical protein
VAKANKADSVDQMMWKSIDSPSDVVVRKKCNESKSLADLQLNCASQFRAHTQAISPLSLSPRGSTVALQWLLLLFTELLEISKFLISGLLDDLWGFDCPEMSPEFHIIFGVQYTHHNMVCCALSPWQVLPFSLPFFDCYKIILLYICPMVTHFVMLAPSQEHVLFACHW